MNEKEALRVRAFIVCGQKHPAVTIHSFERMNHWHRRLNLVCPIFNVFYAVKTSEGYLEQEAWIASLHEAVYILRDHVIGT
jgi:hypothetical protein